MKLPQSFFIILAVLFLSLFSAADGYAYPEYCPDPGDGSCLGCHGPPQGCSTTPTTWTITASAGAGGSISPAGAVSVNNGSSQQFTISPFSGYEISNVLVDGASIGAQTLYTFSNVSADHTITASFFQPTGPPPVADFSMTPLTTTDPYIVSFTDLSTNGPTTWAWDFGDGTTSTQSNPYHAYLSAGTYTVTLEASNSNGSDFFSQNIDVAFSTCPNSAVDLGGWQQSSIQAAYDSAVEGDVIMIQARDFNENIILDRNITVTLSGGHDCYFAMNPAATKLSSGSVTITNGTLVAENLILQSSGSALDGALLYAQNCANCHGELANSTKTPTTTTAVQSAIDTNVGGMGYLNFLTPEEVQAIVDTLNAQEPPPTSCTSCHGQPPDGSAFPDTDGAHIVHDALGFGAVVPSCTACHEGATHLNGIADLGISSNFDAQSGPAVTNSDGTCSSTRCHGGQTTPSWPTGSINVNTDCTDCHERRQAGAADQYNDYYSGEHNKHVQGEGYACTVCHNTSILATGHFVNLETSAFEQDPADTIGGGSTLVPSYNGSCTLTCHGENHNNENW